MLDTQYTITGYYAETAAVRYQWMDISRGLGVILIVIVHAGSIYVARGETALPGWIRTLDLALAPYRVPLLIFLSGMLLSRSLAKGSAEYVKGKLRNLAWPFFLWTAIFLLALSGPASWLAIKPWLGNTPLWYLAFLGIYFAIALVLARVPFMVIAAYALMIGMIAPEGPIYGRQLCVMMTYFFVGAQAGRHPEHFASAIRSKWIMALVPLVVALSAYFTMSAADTKFSPFIVPLVIAAIICMCGVFNLAARGPVAAAFAFAGRNSLIYYVVHLPVQILIHGALFTYGITAPYPCIGLALAAGLVAATILALGKSRSRFVRLLFEGPDFRLGPSLSRLMQKVDDVFLPARPELAGEPAGSQASPRTGVAIPAGTSPPGAREEAGQ